MSTLSFQIIREDGTTTSEVDVSFDAARFTLKEMVRVEEVLGEDMAARFMKGDLPFTPRTLQAILWAKLRSQIPDLGIDDFDLPGEAFADITTDAETETVGA